MATFLDLLNENNTVSITTVTTSLTTMKVSWTLPLSYTAYDGALVLLSTTPFNPSNNPVSGSAYNGSSDWTSPLSTIGGANVIAAIYGAHGNNVTINSIDVTNLAPNVIYYAAVFICDSVLQYAPPILSYSIDTAEPNLNPNVPGGSIEEAYQAPINPTLGQVYYNPANNTVSMWNGTTWQTVLQSTVTTGKVFPTGTAYTVDPIRGTQTPFISSSAGTIPPLVGPVLAGTFFFNTTNKILYIYDGTNWKPANTNQTDVPLYEKIPIGTNGSSLERIGLVNDLKNQLGWPKVCVELNEDQFNLAVNLALKELRRRSDSAYHRKHLLFPIHPNQPVYYMNNPEDDTDKIVDIIKIHRITQFGTNVLGGDNGVFNQTFFNQVFQAGQAIDILSIFEIAQLGETYSVLFAGELQYEWRENTRELRVLRKLYREECVVLEAVMERTEQDLIRDRWTTNWIYEWALAVCYEQLGMIRGKYQSLPGANGISMNGSELSQKAETMKIELMRQVVDYEVGNNTDWNGAGVLLG